MPESPASNPSHTLWSDLRAALRGTNADYTQIPLKLIQIPLAWTLALPLGWVHSGVFWGVFVSETAVGLFTLWLFSRGRWKTVKV